MGAQQSSNSSHGTDEGDLSKRCYYEVLGVDHLASDVEIKKAYKKKALELHPDRNFGDTENATARFAEVQSAYEVLTDIQERAWYDSYRESLLREKNLTTGGQYKQNARFTGVNEIVGLTNKFNRSMPFTNDPSGFYCVFGNIFSDIAREEELSCLAEGLQPTYYPKFGSPDDDYETCIRPFYRVWTNFSSQKSFLWKNVHRLSDAPDRATRRYLEKENKRLREEGIREFNTAVRALVIFIRKRDPRYIQVLQTEQSRQEVLRCAAAEQAARSRAENNKKIAKHIVPEWAKIQEPIEEEIVVESEESEKEQIECVVCGKIFKSENQYNAHEKSKKHIKAVKQLKRELQKESKILNLDAPNHVNFEEQIKPEPQTESQHVTEFDSEIKDEKELDLCLERKCDDFNNEVASQSSENSDLGKDVNTGDPTKIPGKKIIDQRQRPGKAKLKRAKKKAKDIENKCDNKNFECKTCGNEFMSKNKLFHHLRTSKHAELTHV